MPGSWRTSIRKKLVLLFTVNATVALTISCLIFWFYLTISYRETLVSEELATAQIVADNSVSALTFDDEKAATETLNSLRSEPRIERACMYGKKGALFASYQRKSNFTSCPATLQADGVHFTFRALNIVYPVLLDNEVSGQLLLQVSLQEMYARLLRFGALSLLVLFGVALLSFLFSFSLQKVISDPILHLTAIANLVSANGNYALRATSRSDDETGVLIGKFNAMMEQIHQRDLKLQHAQDELEERVGQRTQQLRREIAEREVIQQSLLNAKLQAEESSRAKSAFLANMSHELRTPLNAILGYSEMLEEDAEERGNQSDACDLRKIQSAGKHLLSLISDILDLSKIEAGRVELAFEVISIDAIVSEVSFTIHPLARKQGNLFVVEIDRPFHLVRVDAIKFRQALLNLLSNACKFTSNGRVMLRIRQAVEDEKKYILWEVEDTGIGIAKEDQGRLFAAFTQVDSSATRRHGGTGLGLAISQRLIEMMGGWISVDSELGRGSIFCIHLPDTELREGDSDSLAPSAMA
jgi:signal transduction histidine kinase